MVDLVCGKWRVGVDPREEVWCLKVAIEEGHLGLGNKESLSLMDSWKRRVDRWIREGFVRRRIAMMRVI